MKPELEQIKICYLDRIGALLTAVEFGQDPLDIEVKLNIIQKLTEQTLFLFKFPDTRRLTCDHGLMLPLVKVKP